MRASAFVLALAVHAAASAQTHYWTEGPALRQARSHHTLAVADDALFVLAGSGADLRPVGQVERFDGERWTRETDLPEALNAPAAVGIGERIYVIGGFIGSGYVPTNHVHVYDNRSKKWSKAAPLPMARGGHAAVVLNGKIHVVGGLKAESAMADHSVYDPATNKWMDGAPLPRALGAPATVVFQGKIWVIGGRRGRTDFGDTFIYDEAADAWTRGHSMPPRSKANAVVMDNTIWVLGGETQPVRASLDTVLRLSADGQRWEDQPALPTPRFFFRAASFKDAIWTVGGQPSERMFHGSAGSTIVERLGAPNRN